jgi:hypothetical protein
MRLIDADALLKKFTKATVPYSRGIMEIPVVRLETIKNAPTVDAEPVRHGRWILCLGEIYKCSICGYQQKAYALSSHFKYCTNCGAKMDEEEKDCERCLQVTERPGNDICKACGGRRGQDASRVEESDLRDLRE